MEVDLRSDEYMGGPMIENEMKPQLQALRNGTIS
jgi:hypothetical protein